MTLILDLDERVDSEDLRLEIGRSYAYVGSTLVRTHAAAGEDAPVENTMRMLVKLGTRQYLAAGEEGSNELWNDVMRDWFRNQFRKLGNQALIYNKRQKEMEDGSELAFTWLEVDLQNGTLPVRLHMDDVSGIAEDAADMLSLVRDAYNEGKLGDAGSIARVSMPSDEDWAAQVEAGAVAFAERKAAEEAAAAEAEAAADAERAVFTERAVPAERAASVEEEAVDSIHIYGQRNVNPRLVLVANEAAWIEVRRGENILISRVLNKGDRYQVSRNPDDLFLKTGNAGGLDIFLDGEQVPPVGPKGALRSNVPLNPDYFVKKEAAELDE